MLTVSILTIHPDFIRSYLRFGPMARAEKLGHLRVQAINLRNFAVDHHGTVDDRPYGGGDGMVLRCEPVAKSLESLKPDLVIALGPAGKPWTQREVESMGGHCLENKHIALICGRFGGLDKRIYDLYVHAEYSLGDFILSGGELAALCVVDSLSRLIPGALGHNDSARLDSFSPELGGGLEHDLYTRPEEFAGLRVPDVLISGDHKKIEVWRKANSLQRTHNLRPDLA